jgi:hypothetical protein
MNELMQEEYKCVYPLAWKKGLGLVITVVIPIAILPRCFSGYANEYVQDILFVSTRPLIYIYVSCIWALVSEI